MASTVKQVGVYEVEVDCGRYFVSNKSGELVAELDGAVEYAEWVNVHKSDTLHESMTGTA